MVELNFTPSSTEALSPLSTIEGLVVVGQRLAVTGAATAAVVKELAASAARALPAVSFTPLAPPLTTMV